MARTQTNNKILNGYEVIDGNIFIKLKVKVCRGTRTKVKLVKEQRRLDMRKYLFYQRIIIEWNKLSTSTGCVVTANSVNMFKHKIGI